jgi:predicted protein tyrosine phosphatase
MNHVNIPQITICAATELRSLNPNDYTHFVSIWAAHAPKKVMTLLDSMFPSAKRHVVFFDDITDDDANPSAPTVDNIRGIIQFASLLQPEHSLLVQCLAGISRSSACAYAIACQHSVPGVEAEILESLVEKFPGIRPNRRITRIADEILGRNGMMVAAVDAHLAQIAAQWRNS